MRLFTVFFKRALFNNFDKQIYFTFRIAGIAATSEEEAAVRATERLREFLADSESYMSRVNPSENLEVILVKELFDCHGQVTPCDDELMRTYHPDVLEKRPTIHDEINELLGTDEARKTFWGYGMHD